MQSINTHLKILIALLVSLCLLITGYQIYVLDIPVREDETDDIWSLDARFEFQATQGVPVKAQMFIPPLTQDFISLNESFISNNYGVSINQVPDSQFYGYVYVDGRPALVDSSTRTVVWVK